MSVRVRLGVLTFKFFKMDKSIKVIICDDHSLFRQGVKTWLETKDNIDVVGEMFDNSQ